MTPSSPTTSRRRSLLRVGALVALALLAAGHVGYWYLPRQRTGILDPATPAGDLLLSAPGARLWLPFPHQNALAASLIELAEGAGGGSRMSQMPRFGPLRLPPASELAVARSAETTTIVVRVYPSWALVGKLAGRLTGNPWLKAGSFGRRGERVEVAWRGTSWIVTLGDARREPPSISASTARAGGDAVRPRLAAAVALDHELLPEAARGAAARNNGEAGVDLAAIWGLEQVVEQESGTTGEAELVRISVLGARATAAAPSASSFGSPTDACAETRAREIALCWLETVASPPGAGAAAGERALVLLSPSAPFDRHVFRLPSAASLVRGRAGGPPPRRISLPAEKLARRLDAELLGEVRGGWEISALDEASLQSAAELADRWSATGGPEQAAPRARDLDRAARLRARGEGGGGRPLEPRAPRRRRCPRLGAREHRPRWAWNPSMA